MRQAPRTPAQQAADEGQELVYVDARSESRDGVTLTPLSEIARTGPDNASAVDGVVRQNPGVGTVIDRAVEGAQRGIENQAVPPSRSELVRRVFERYSQRAKAKQGAPANAQPANTDGAANKAPDAAPASPSPDAAPPKRE